MSVHITSLYGLKQTFRSWFDRFFLHIQQTGFVKSSFDHSLFIYCTRDVTTWLLIYVNDIVILENSPYRISCVKDFYQIQDEVR